MKPRQPRKGVRRAPRRETSTNDTPEQQTSLLDDNMSISETLQPSTVDTIMTTETTPSITSSVPDTTLVTPSDNVAPILKPSTETPSTKTNDTENQSAAPQAPEKATPIIPTTSAPDEITPIASPNMPTPESQETKKEVSETTHEALPVAVSSTQTSTPSKEETAKPQLETREPRQPQHNNRQQHPRQQQQQHPRQQHPRQQQPTQPSNRHEQLDFEAALRELETIVTQMEGTRLSLQDSLAAYQRGSRLVQQCQHWLSDAEQQVQTLENNMLTPQQDF
jgi:exodeoxyribonuclease VII small subunit